MKGDLHPGKYNFSFWVELLKMETQKSPLNCSR